MNGSAEGNSRQPDAVRPRRFRFSLGYLCVFTAIVAAWTAAFVARQKNAKLQPQLDALVSLDCRLNVEDPNEVFYAVLPKIAPDFEAWDLHIPVGKPRELRFHCGNVSVGGLPQEFESGLLSPGRHRVVFRIMDYVKESFRFEVYIDDHLVIEKEMGSDWMPEGWRHASGYNPRKQEAKSVYLDGRRYLPAVDLERGEYFKGKLDRNSTELGYLLWVDEVGRSPKPINAFLGLDGGAALGRVGLRDGLRCYGCSTVAPARYGLIFSHPATHTYDPVLNVELEFLIDQKVILKDLSTGFLGWKMSDSAEQLTNWDWEIDPTKGSRSLFLHGESKAGGLAPVVELHWSEDRPNEVGLRLPKVPANASITSWRLRCTEGASHLWRIIESGDFEQDSRKVSNQPPTDRIEVSLASADEGRQSAQWRTDIVRPLQVYQRDKANSAALAAVKLYNGLPFEFGCEFSDSTGGKVWATCEDKFLDAANTPIIGGAVFDEVIIELDVVEIDDASSGWVWLRAEPR